LNFGWGSAPDPAGELTALPQTPWLDLRGLFLREEREWKGEREEKKAWGREGKGKGDRKGRDGREGDRERGEEGEKGGNEEGEGRGRREVKGAPLCEILNTPLNAPFSSVLKSLH